MRALPKSAGVNTSAMTDKQIDPEIYDITFIGAGPVALYGMYYAGLRMTRFKAIDMLEDVGGGLMALYPEKYIYDVAGFPKVLAKDLVRQLGTAGNAISPTVCASGEKVTERAQKTTRHSQLTTDKGVHYSKIGHDLRRTGRLHSARMRFRISRSSKVTAYTTSPSPERFQGQKHSHGRRRRFGVRLFDDAGAGREDDHPYPPQ